MVEGQLLLKRFSTTLVAAHEVSGISVYTLTYIRLTYILNLAALCLSLCLSAALSCACWCWWYTSCMSLLEKPDWKGTSQ